MYHSNRDSQPVTELLQNNLIVLSTDSLKFHFHHQGVDYWYSRKDCGLPGLQSSQQKRFARFHVCWVVVNLSGKCWWLYCWICWVASDLYTASSDVLQIPKKDKRMAFSSFSSVSSHKDIRYADSLCGSRPIIRLHQLNFILVLEIYYLTLLKAWAYLCMHWLW